MSKDMRLVTVVVSSVFFFCLPLGAEAASSGPNSPGTITSVAIFGFPTPPSWSNPENAAASDDVRTSVIVDDSSISELLQATDYGFTLPSDATVNGIEVAIERYGGTKDYAVNIIKGGVLGNENKANNVFWPQDAGTEASRTYGGASDLWSEAWTASDINSTDFGVSIRVEMDDNSQFFYTGYIDHITITVHYTVAASAPSGGGGNAAWLIRLRQQNGLDYQDNPISSSSSSSSASATSSSVHSVPFTPSATSSSAPGNITQAADWSWVSDSDPAPAAWIINFRMRVCERIGHKNFLSTILERLNARLGKRFGFTCTSP